MGRISRKHRRAVQRKHGSVIAQKAGEVVRDAQVINDALGEIIGQVPLAELVRIRRLPDLSPGGAALIDRILARFESRQASAQAAAQAA